MTRPTAQELVEELVPIHQLQWNVESKRKSSAQEKLRQCKMGHKRSLSEEEIVVRKSPSEKARFHFLALPSSRGPSVMSIGKEMSIRDPHYRPAIQNPFATLPRLREGKKIIGSSRDLFSSCFELPSPARVATPTSSFFDSASHVNSPNAPIKSTSLFDLGQNSSVVNSTPRSRFEDHLFHGRVELLKRLYSGGVWTTQDDSVLSSFSSSGSSSCSNASSMASGNGAQNYFRQRRGSCESGFCSVGTMDDWFSMQLSSCSAATRSMGSSLLTVSDLEEDLRAASAFLSSSHKRTSSIFTDSNDDLSSLAPEDFQVDSIVNGAASLMTNGGSNAMKTGYEKDIRDIVEYFEASCRTIPRNPHHRHHHHLRLHTGPKVRFI